VFFTSQIDLKGRIIRQGYSAMRFIGYPTKSQSGPTTDSHIPPESEIDFSAGTEYNTVPAK
jgi:hypothetical protein